VYGFGDVVSNVTVSADTEVMIDKNVGEHVAHLVALVTLPLAENASDHRLRYLTFGNAHLGLAEARAALFPALGSSTRVHE